MGDEQDVLDLLAGVAGGQLGDDVIEQGDANEAAAAAAAAAEVADPVVEGDAEEGADEGGAAVDGDGAPPQGPMPGMPPAIPPLGGVPDEDEVFFSKDLAAAIDRHQLGQTFSLLAKVLGNQFGVSLIAEGMLIHHRVKILGANGEEKVVTLSCVHGEERSLAVHTWVLTIMPEVLARRSKLTAYALTASLLTVLNEIDPDPKRTKPQRSDRRSRGDVDDDEEDDRNGSPASNTRSALIKAQAMEKAKETMNEMSETELKRRLECVAKLPGTTPTIENLCHRNQLKRLEEEVVQLRQVPSHANIQPSVMKYMAGANGLVAARAKKGEDVFASPCLSVLDCRRRLKCFAVSLVLVSCWEADAAETREGVMAFYEAVEESEGLVTLAQVRVIDDGRATRTNEVVRMHATIVVSSCNVTPDILQVSSAISLAMYKARRSCGASNGSRARSIGKSFFDAADVIFEKNCSALEKQVIDPFPVATEVVKPDGKPDPVTVKKESSVRLANGEYKVFERMKGGNPNCPVACTRKSCNKKQLCARSHSGK